MNYWEVVYLNTNNADEIKKFYNSIMSTNYTLRKEELHDINEAEPNFIIEIKYSNGAVDVVNMY